MHVRRSRAKTLNDMLLVRSYDIPKPILSFFGQFRYYGMAALVCTDCEII